MLYALEQAAGLAFAGEDEAEVAVVDSERRGGAAVAVALTLEGGAGGANVRRQVHWMVMPGWMPVARAAR